MNTTEENIVYQLLASIRAAELNNDEVIDERYIRALMRTHRATILEKVTLSGQTIPDSCFQRVSVSLSKISDSEYHSLVPHLIPLGDNFGVKLMSLNGSNIPVLSEENYHLSKRNPISKNSPKAYLYQNSLFIFIGAPISNAINGASSHAKMIDCLNKRGLVSFSAVLDNPDDAIDYNWTSSPYPFPQENIEDLKSSILKKDFNLVLQTKSDQVPNMKNDTLRYHDQGKVQE